MLRADKGCSSQLHEKALADLVVHMFLSVKHSQCEQDIAVHRFEILPIPSTTALDHGPGMIDSMTSKRKEVAKTPQADYTPGIDHIKA